MFATIGRLVKTGDARLDIARVLALLWLFVAIGLLSLLIPAGARLLTEGWASALTVLGAGLFLAGGATLFGTAVGFLFGVPRYRVTDAERAVDVAPNTNLEQISDWLTKILVGVGLTQIGEAGALLTELGDRWGPVFADEPSGSLIAASMFVHYVVMGFFQGFLLASLWLPRAMERAWAERAKATAAPKTPEPDESAA